MKKILIIIFLGLLTYAPVLFNGFVWDDEVMFQKAASMPSNVYFRPVISALYWGIYNVFGPRPFFFHFFQLIFHIATAVLIYYLFKRFFKEIIFLILAVIFLVHPASVEAVSFASAMQEVGFTLVGIIGLYLFVGRDVINHVSTKNILFGTLFISIALLMKETAIVFFLLVFCYLFLFERKNQIVLISYSIFSVILLMAYFLFRVSGGSLYVQGQGLFPIMRVSLATRLMNIPMIILYYLGKFFYPMNLAIAQHWVIKAVEFQDFWLPLLFGIGLFFVAVFYILKTKSKTFTFFFLWFLLGLLPHLQIIPLNMTVAERWLYFPMIGLLGMIGSLIGNYGLDPRLHGDDKQMSFPRRRESSLLIILGIIIISTFSVRSFIRVLDWRSGLSLFSHDIRQNSSFDLQNNMGVELFRIGQYKEAKKYFEISTKLAPYWWVNWNNLGVIYEREKNYQKATVYYQKAIDNGQYYLAYENLAKILVLHRKNQKKTEEFLKKALKIFPENKNLQQISSYYQQQ
ncbi:MAG: hypothetical protein AAB788_01340 [Patescibacteria group bacterium]